MKIKSVIFVLICIFCTSVHYIFTYANDADKKINIACSDDSSGLIMHYIECSDKFSKFNIVDTLNSNTVTDCCSNTLNMGLASNDIDIAIMCPNSAQELIKKDDRFENLGGCIKNSNIIIMREQTVKKIGIRSGREYEADFLYEKFGNDISIIPMLTQSLPYSLEKGNVDAILTDAFKGFNLLGPKFNVMKAKEEATYSLIVNKKFKETKEFKEFIDVFNESLNKLNKFEVLISQIKKFKHIEINSEEEKFWRELNLEFIPIKV